MPENDSYVLRRQGRTDGPWPMRKLRAEVEIHKLGRHHEVSIDGGATWVRADQIEGLFPSVPAAGRRPGGPGGSTALDSEISNDGAPANPEVKSGEGAVWYYYTNDEQNGPVTIIELAEAVVEGVCDLDALVWKEGMADWVPAEQIPQIVAVLENPTSDGSATAQTRFIQAATSGGTPSSQATIGLGVSVTALLLSWVPLVGFVGVIGAALGGLAYRRMRSQGGLTRFPPVPIAAVACGALAVIVALLVTLALIAALLLR